MVGIIFGNTSKNDKHNLGTTIYMFYKHKSYHSQSYIQLLSTLDTHFWSVENSLLWHFHPSPPPPPNNRPKDPNLWFSFVHHLPKHWYS